MSKILQRPLACRNAHCGAMCSPADASFFGGNPSICLNYERRDDLYRDDKLLDKVKKAREKIDDLDRYFDNDLYSDNEDSMFKCNEVLNILDKLIAESED